MTIAGENTRTWAPTTTDLRSLSLPGGAARSAATWSGYSFSADVNTTDGQQHQIALYTLDWNRSGRSQKVDVIDADTLRVLDSRVVSNFEDGQYLVYNVTGHVQFQLTALSGSAAYFSGLFFNAPVATSPPPASPPPASPPPAANTPPQVSNIANQSILSGSTAGPLSFTVADLETPTNALSVSVASSNAALLAASGITLGGSGANRTITLTPIAGQIGTSTITVTVTDAGGLTAVNTFALNVANPNSNSPPQISNIANQTVQDGNTSGSLAFTVSDVETAANALTATAVSSNATLLPASGISFGGSGASRTITLTPIVGQVGTSAITVTVTDAGGLTATSTFTLNVTNAPPHTSNIADQAVRKDTPTGNIAFTISDLETSANLLSVTATSSNAALVQASGIALGGSGANRTISLTPVAGQVGSTTITLTVTDAAGLTATDTFILDVAAPSDGGVTVTSNWITTPFDRIPNFGGHPTISAIQTGVWSDPATWGGRLPLAGDVVSIPSGVSVTYDQVSDVKLDTVAIQAGGVLQFRTDVNTRLRVTNLLVMPNGTLTIGTAANPVTAGVQAQVIINDTPIDTTRDPEQYGHGLIGLGKVTMHGAAMSDTFIRLGVEPKAGDTTLILATRESGWRVGDRLVLPDTRQWNDRITDNQIERPVIASVSADGLSVTLTQPLSFDHLGARDGDGVLTFVPQVGNLVRNVLLKSENPIGTRGHTFFTVRADVDIEYAQFAGVGRTMIDSLDNTLFDANGNVTHVGTNQMNRLPVNFEHLIGPTTPQSNGYQFTFVGNSVVCLNPLDVMSERWGITINDSHYGLIAKNVLYNWAGAGIVTVQGNETGNVIESNFVVRITGTGNRGDGRLYNPIRDFAYEGTGIWLRGGNNIVRDNAIADAGKYGVNIFTQSAGTQLAPAFQGADPRAAGQGVSYDPSGTPLREFARNEVYGMTSNGMTIWTLGAGYAEQSTIGLSTIKDFRVWHINDNGFFFYPVNNILIDGFVARNDWSQLRGSIMGGTGVYFGDYLSANITIANSDIQGFAVGITVPLKTGDVTATGNTIQPTIIEKSYLRNRINISLPTMNAVTGGGERLTPRRTVISDVLFASPPSGLLSPSDSSADIFKDYLGISQNNANYIQLDQVFVYNYNRVVGDNFQVYYMEQAASFITPKNGSTLGAVGSQEAGLTNRQNWVKYGIAIAGEMAPDSATTRARIYGLIRTF